MNTRRAREGMVWMMPTKLRMICPNPDFFSAIIPRGIEIRIAASNEIETR